MFSQPLNGGQQGNGGDMRHGAEDRASGSLEDEMVFKIIVICLAMITLMQKEGRFASVISFAYMFYGLS